MIPVWVLVALYLLTGIFVIYGAKFDFHYVRPARYFLGHTLLGWGVFYVLVELDWDFSLLRILSRWLQLPLIVSIAGVTAARIYGEKKSR